MLSIQFYTAGGPEHAFFLQIHIFLVAAWLS